MIEVSVEFDPVYMISGSDDFRRERCRREFINLYVSSSGGNIEEVPPERLKSKISSRSFFIEPCLYIISNVTEENYDLILRHNNSPFPQLVFLVVVTESIRKNSIQGSLSEVLGSKKHKKFEEVPKNKQFDAACEFFIKEVRSSGLSINIRTARKVVNLAGTDFGFLFYQAWKLVNLAQFEGSSEITEETVERVPLGVFEVSLFPFVESVGNKQPFRFLKEVWEIERSHISPVMMTCRFLGSFVLKWKAAQNLIERQIEEEEILEILKVTSWYYQNRLQRFCSNWSPEELSQLISVCSDTEQAVFSGKVDPWIWFCSKTYQLLNPSSQFLQREAE